LTKRLFFGRIESSGRSTSTVREESPMIDKSRWEVPATQQPRPEELGYDLDQALQSIVTVHAEIPDDAFTAKILGTERAGSGVVIRDTGLVLTIGYLVTEAENVLLATANERIVPAHPIAIDQESGFALVQALGALDLPAMALGDARTVGIGEPVIMAGGGGGRKQAVRARMVGKEEFSGYWEYHLREALFSAPAHPLWGGAGLIGPDGALIGIGSLHVQQSDGRGKSQDVNMSVPIDLLPPVLEELLAHGKLRKPARPWLGVYSTESAGRVVVADVTEEGPAANAGLRGGDIITSVRDTAVESLGDFYREIWSCGPAGTEIPIEIVRDKRSLWLRVKSADRASYLKKPRMH
jgi:S1-C subfamily serine protease